MRISDWSSDVCSSDLYLELAVQHGVGFVLESASWRASPDWAAPLGLSLSELDALNVASVDLLHELRDEFAPLGSPILASGCMGPRGAGYDPGRIMSPAEAQDYPGHPSSILAPDRPDLPHAFLMNKVRTDERRVGTTSDSPSRYR